MLVLDDLDGERSRASPERLHAGSRRSASTGPRRGRGCRTSPCSASASARGCDPPLPGTGTFVPSDAAAYLSRLHPTGAQYEVLESSLADRGG